MKNYDINQLEIESISSKKVYFSIIESLLFVSGEPLNIKEIASIIECSVKFAEELLAEFSEFYNEERRGIKLIRINDSYQLVTKEENSTYVQKLLKTNSRQSLSQAALETLAIIAYNQPITRISIDEIRGVKSDRAVQTLVERNLIKDVGRLEVAGRPILYTTTEEFLKYFGLTNIGEMPSLEEILKEIAEKTEEVSEELIFEEIAKENEELNKKETDVE